MVDKKQGKRNRWSDISPEERFWKNVNKEGSVPQHVPYLGKCWIWMGYKDYLGYGHIHRVGYPTTHRYSYKITFGDFDKNLCVLHKCDNPPCVNPNHLFLGTHSDNSKDKFAKNRFVPSPGKRNGQHTHPEKTARGEDVVVSKLTNEKVIKIRKLFKKGNYKYVDLSKIFGVTPECISLVVRRKTWRHLK